MAELEVNNQRKPPVRRKLSELLAEAPDTSLEPPLVPNQRPQLQKAKTDEDCKVSCPEELYPMTCKYSKLRFSPGHWESFKETFYKRMDNRRHFCRLDHIAKRTLELENLEIDWVTVGILAHRSETRISKVKQEYQVWRLTNFSAELSLFAYGESPKLELQLGSVLAVLSPNLQTTSAKLSLQIDNSERVMLLGTSRDWALCSEDGCQASVNQAKEEICVDHLEAKIREARLRRHAVNVNPIGLRKRSIAQETAEAPIPIATAAIRLPEKKFGGRGSQVLDAIKQKTAKEENLASKRGELVKKQDQQAQAAKRVKADTPNPTPSEMVVDLEIED